MGENSQHSNQSQSPCHMLLHFSIVMSQQGKCPQELWTHLRQVVQGLCHCLLCSLQLWQMMDQAMYSIHSREPGGLVTVLV